MTITRAILTLTITASAAAACNQSSLAERICDPAEIRCVDAGISEICNVFGTHWVQSACASNEVCITSTCDGANVYDSGCLPKICDPGALQCDPANQTSVLKCDPSGADWCCVGSCAAPNIDGVCFKGSCVSVCSQGQKSYLGCEYFAVDLDNANVPCGIDDQGQLFYCDAAASPFAVVISNPNPQQQAVFMVADGPFTATSSDELCHASPQVVEAGVLPPKGLQIVNIPRRAAPSLPDVNGTIKAPLAFRIASNIPITVYQFNPLDNVDVFSNDASLLMPTNTAGQKYYVMSREQTFDDLKGFVTIVGIDKQVTTVTFTTTARTLAGPGIPALMPGQQYTTTLNQFDVLNIESNEIGSDFTGSLVTADRPIIVFSGSEAANAPSTSRCDLTTNTCEWDGVTVCECTQADGPLCSPHEKCSDFITNYADHLEQQMYPLTAWGSEYVGARSMPRGAEKDVWRILAAENDTQVTLTPAFMAIPALNAGKWFEFETNEDFLISANKPILVGQFLAGSDGPNPGRQPDDASTGDPAFMLAVPVRQYRDAYVFLAPDQYEEDFVSISLLAGTVARLDGVKVDDIYPLFSDSVDVQINDIVGTVWQAIRLRISDGYHVLTCEQPCAVMVHGYDRDVSYGYPGGLNLEDDEDP